MAPLTYDRLFARLDVLYDMIPEQFPEPGDAQRVHDVQEAIKEGIVAAQAGLRGDHGVMPPGQLKHWVNAKIAAIHEQFGESEQASPRSNSSKENNTTTPAVTVKKEPATPKPAATKKTSAVTKRPIRNPTATNAGIKKPASKRTTRAKSRIESPTTRSAISRTADEQEAAAALLDLFGSSPLSNKRGNTHSHHTSSFGPQSSSAPISNINQAHQRVYVPAQGPQPFPPLYFPNVPPKGPVHPNPFRRTGSGNEFLDLPANAIDTSASPEETFLAGVKFAMQNFTAAHATRRCGNDDMFANHCYEYVRVELGIKSEYEKAVENYDAEQAAAAASLAGAKRVVGKGFWDVV